MDDFYKIKSDTLVGIGDAIRAQNGKTNAMTPEEMRVEILNLFSYAYLTPVVITGYSTDTTISERILNVLLVSYTTLVEEV